MAVKIRLSRHGRKKQAIYDIVVSDARAPRDGKFIEKIGQYNPNSTPAGVNLKNERALYWLMVGAQPTDTTRKILSVHGVMLQKHLQVGVLKGAITQEVADTKFAAWLDDKANARATKLAKITSDKASSKKAVLDAERKKKEDVSAKKIKAEQDLIAASEAAAAGQNAAVIEEVVDAVEENVEVSDVTAAESVDVADVPVIEEVAETEAVEATPEAASKEIAKADPETTEE